MRVIVTGAAGALGGAVARTFEAGGARVARIVRTGGGDGSFACADLADPALARAAIAEAANWLGGVDALILAAGGFLFARVEQATAADWTAQFQANTLSALNTVQEVLRHMDDGGSIVAIGAASAQPAGAGMAAYAASKSGVARLVEALAAELAPRAIRANAVLPAIIDTPANRAAMPDADPAGWTTPAAIAEVIRFLASPAARAINGAAIPVTNKG